MPDWIQKVCQHRQLFKKAILWVQRDNSDERFYIVLVATLGVQTDPSLLEVLPSDPTDIDIALKLHMGLQQSILVNLHFVRLVVARLVIVIATVVYRHSSTIIIFICNTSDRNNRDHESC